MKRFFELFENKKPLNIVIVSENLDIISFIDIRRYFPNKKFYDISLLEDDGGDYVYLSKEDDSYGLRIKKKPERTHESDEIQPEAVIIRNNADLNKLK